MTLDLTGASTVVDVASTPGTLYLLVADADAALPADLELLVDGRRPPTVRATPEPDGSDAVLAEARTGDRVLAVGSPGHLLRAARLARSSGFLDSELAFVETGGDGDRPVFCPHCECRFDAAVAPGAVTGCPGCGRGLEVRPHISARHGAHLAAVVE